MIKLACKKSNIAVVFLLLFAAAAIGAPVVLDSSLPAGAELNVVSVSPRETIIEFRLGAITVDTAQSNSDDWISLAAEGMQLTSQSGWPELPQKSVWITAIPGSTVELLDSESSLFTWGTIRPAPEPLSRSGVDQLRRTPSPEFYSQSQHFPDAPVVLSLQGNLRGAPVGLVTLVPVQFDPATNECTVYSQLRVRVSHPRSALDDAGPRSRSTQDLLARLNISQDDSSPIASIGSPRLIVVTEPQFLTALQPLIEWKTRSGLPVASVIYSDVASSAPQLRTYLSGLVDTAEVAPDFLLIVGDADVVPAFFGVGGSLTDHPYSTLIGSDYLPDWSVGRLPCQTALECSDWVDRLLAYERDGVINADANATVFSSDAALDPQHGIYVSNLLGAAGLSTEHLQEPQSSTLPLLMNSLNSGREWIFYIGHGYPQAWSSVHPSFNNEHASELQISSSSIVVAVACATSDFDFPGHSLAEHWLAQSFSSGLLAYFGATEPTAFFYSDTIGLGALRAVFAQDIAFLGMAADLGKLATAQAFPQQPGGLTEETIQQFALLGDPSLRVFSSSPQSLSVNYPAIVPLTAANVSVSVHRNGQPVSEATVCVSTLSGDVYFVTETSSAGDALIPLGLGEPAVLDVTVTARNAVPFLGTLQVVPPNGAFLQISSMEVLDSLGDNDGRADRGETCELRIAIANLGNQASAPGTVSISCDDPRLEFAASTLEFPAVDAADTIVCPAIIPFAVADTVSDLSAALLTIQVEAADDADFTIYHPLVLHAPRLAVLDQNVVEQSGDNDGQPEAGEVMQLILRLRNIGSDQLSPASVQLSESSPYVIVQNSPLLSNLIAAGDTLVVAFLLETSPDMPRGYLFDFACEISSSNYLPEFHNGSLRINQIPVFLFELDQQPQQVNAIAAALASLGIEHERSGELPQSLTQYRSIWVFCGVFPNQVPLTYSNGNALAQYVVNGGNCYLEGGDTWAFDIPTPLHPLFHVVGTQDGTSNAGPFIGEYGTEYQDYSFAYDGENTFMDQIEPGAGASVIVRNNRNNAHYPVCIAYAGENYRTIGSSVELGSVLDAEYPSTRVHLVSDICRWFGIESRADIFPPAILHTPIIEFRRQNVFIPVTADIQDASGIESADVFYRINGGAESSVNMNLVNGIFRGLIPGGSFGDSIRYRIRALDNSPLHTAGETAEFTFEIANHADVPIDVHFDRSSHPEISARVNGGSRGSWSLVRQANEATALELHSSLGDTVSYTTDAFDASSLTAGTLNISHILSVNSPGAFVRIIGSADGGSSFPFSLWQRAATEISENGTLTLPNLESLAGKSDVVLRFEFSGSGYWRIFSITVSSDTMPATAPVANVTISAHGGSVRLFWPHVENASHYVVHASAASGEPRFSPIAVVRDTTFADPDVANYDFRLYTVAAILRGASSSAPVTNTITPTAIRDVDRIWQARLHHNE